MEKHLSDSEVPLLLQLIDEAYEKRSWHGTNLRGSIRGITAGQAVWRPARTRHNIWEIIVHTAYWKYVVRRRLLGEKKGSFPLKGSNWFARPTGKADLQNDIRLLDDVHRSLREAVASLNPARLRNIPLGNRFSPSSTISGIAFHDIYHAGQIQLLKRLMKR
jgi:hypothetical protein